MLASDGHYDVVIVGGGIAGSAMAGVLAQRNMRVLVLERQRTYQDRVRGEAMPPWGLAEAQRLGLYTVLLEAGGVVSRWNVPYDETRTPEEAEAQRADRSQALPGVPGGLYMGHPAACTALSQTAEAAGATVLRGIGRVSITPGPRPEVEYALDGTRRRVRCRLIIGADGRTSTVRQQAGIHLRRMAPTHLIVGLLVGDVPDWPEDTGSLGTEGDLHFLIFPQGHGRVRLYACTALDQRDRFAGPQGAARFLAAYRGLTCLRHAQALGAGRPLGPCGTFGGEDTWTEAPLTEGVVLIGDAAGYNDPIIGQGLALALRDVRGLTELLLAEREWSPARLQPYAEERLERMRRVRFTAALSAALRSEFGPAAVARRRRFFARLAAGADKSLALAMAAQGLGPDRMPAWAYEDEVRRRALE